MNSSDLGVIEPSHYMDMPGGELRYPSRPTEAVSARDRQAYESLRTQVLETDYPCVMARSVFNRHTLRVATYGPLGSAGNAEALCRDLYRFCDEFPAPVDGAVSFITCFDGPSPADELAFETALWRQLQAIHDVDKRRFGWADAVGSSPADADFSFSVGARAFFIVGMHERASRVARQTSMPTLVFNLHEQFVELKTVGKFDNVRDIIRTRDRQLQGTVNPMSSDHGNRSEANQYSGRAVGPDWMCPFSGA